MWVLCYQRWNVIFPPSSRNFIILTLSNKELDHHDNENGHIPHLLFKVRPIPHGLMGEKLKHSLFPGLLFFVSLGNFKVVRLVGDDGLG